MFYVYKNGNDELIKILRKIVRESDLKPTKDMYRSLIKYIQNHKVINIFDIDLLIKHQGFKYEDFERIL